MIFAALSLLMPFTLASSSTLSVHCTGKPYSCTIRRASSAPIPGQPCSTHAAHSWFRAFPHALGAAPRPLIPRWPCSPFAYHASVSAIHALTVVPSAVAAWSMASARSEGSEIDRF